MADELLPLRRSQTVLESLLKRDDRGRRGSCAFGPRRTSRLCLCLCLAAACAIAAVATGELRGDSLGASLSVRSKAISPAAIKTRGWMRTIPPAMRQEIGGRAYRRTSQRAIAKTGKEIKVDLPEYLDCSFAFVKDTMVSRCPDKILERTIQYNKNHLTREQMAEIRRIQYEMKENAPLTAITDDGPDKDDWNLVLEPHLGSNTLWWDVPWLLWETYLYRRLLQATNYWQSNHDLFDYEKTTGLVTMENAASSIVEAGVRAGREWKESSLSSLLMLDLWGNQADSSLFTIEDQQKIKQSTSGQAENKVIADDSAKVWEILNREPKNKESGRKVVFFNDNAGLEILSDLSFAHYLLSSKAVTQVEFKLKPYPFFVSDALAADVEKTVKFMSRMDSETAATVGKELQDYLSSGQLRLSSDLFLTSGRPMWQMPDGLRSELEATADLVIVKGDLMYRKLLGDYVFEPATSFQDLISYFPCPVVSLRTLKSPVAVGLEDGVAEAIAEQDKDWLTSGKYGTVQVSDPPTVLSVKSYATPYGNNDRMKEEDAEQGKGKGAEFIVTLA